MTVEAGQELLHYRIVEKIGEGGMGIVWKAEDTRLRRFVALKFVPEKKAHDADAVDRHLREARAASALNHPNICSIHDIGEWQGRRFIVMELLEGRPLQRCIADRPLEVELTVDLAIQIADALTAAHAKGIIHRDLKPANIVVIDDRSGPPRAKLLDFGLAKLSLGSELGAREDDETETILARTASGAVLGTAYYMSPEQALGRPLDHRTDLFSLGVVLYEMLTARRAFGGSTSAAVFDAILNREPAALSSLNPAVPPELERVVDRALEKDPALRYQSSADLCADLRRLRRDSSGGRSAATPRSSPARSSRRLLWVSGAALASVLVVSIAVTQRFSTRLEEPAEATASERLVEEAALEPVTRGPSIAVLPLANASGDPDQEYFSDGLTGDIITELSRFRELSVIAHSSTARFKGSDVDTREIGSLLGARYVLQGSLQKDDQRIRARVQLSDSSDGRMLWGSSYERDLTARGLFALQDELTRQVVQAIAGSYGALTRLGLPEARRKPPASLGSYDCVLRAYEYFQVHTAETHLAARECLERVVEVDPDYADGLAWLGYLYGEEYHHRRNERVQQYDALDRALEVGEEAVRLDTASHLAHGTLAMTLFLRGEIGRARIEARRTIELSPDNALWLSLVGYHLAQQEDFELAVAMVQKAIELSPYPPGWITMPIFYDHYFHGRYEDALVAAKELELQGEFRRPLFLAATLGQLGRTDEAAQELDKLRHVFPQPLAEIREELIERHAISPGLTDRIMDGLMKAVSETEPGKTS